MENKDLKINKKSGVTYLTYPLFENESFCIHASSTREGGVTDGMLGKMNLGLSTPDSRENLKKNYEIFCNATGINYESIVVSSQFHNANIRVCTKKDCGSGISKPLPYSDFDGLITNEKGVTLCVFSADCIPVLLSDPERKAVGACHCGWKGTYKELASLTVWAMEREFGSRLENIKAVIAPGIGKCCYEVSKELYLDFLDKFSFLRNDRSAEEIDGRYFLDLQEINKLLLIKCGICEENIAVAKLCTCCNSELLHSHRATAGKRGIMGHFIGIRE